MGLNSINSRRDGRYWGSLSVILLCRGRIDPKNTIEGDGSCVTRINLQERIVLNIPRIHALYSTLLALARHPKQGKSYDMESRQLLPVFGFRESKHVSASRGDFVRRNIPRDGTLAAEGSFRRTERDPHPSHCHTACGVQSPDFATSLLVRGSDKDTRESIQSRVNATELQHPDVHRIAVEHPIETSMLDIHHEDRQRSDGEDDKKGFQGSADEEEHTFFFIRSKSLPPAINSVTQ